MNGILNKLTVEKFRPLYDQLLASGLSKAAHIEALTRQVFLKATAQHHFIGMYTDLCARLHDWLSENPIIPDAAKVFKRILLNQCQESFEGSMTPPEDLNELQGEEKEQAWFKYKQRMLGNMKFVGELLKVRMVSSKVIFQCCESLMEEDSTSQSRDAALETLSVFLTTIGPIFDSDTFPSHDKLEAIFAEVGKLAAAKGTCARNVVLFKDLLDLRKSRWMKR